MTRDDAITELRSLHGEPEMDHFLADDILCKLLVDLGYSDVVKEYRKVEKWD